MVRPDPELILGDAELVRIVGEINLLWDDIEFFLWYMFDEMLNVNWRYSYAIFFSQQNHRARRDMIEALAEYALENDPEGFKKTMALIKRVKGSAKKRNDISHGIWTENQDGAPGVVRRPVRRRYQDTVATVFSKRELKQIRDQMFILENDLYTFVYPRWEKSQKARRKKELRRSSQMKLLPRPSNS